MSTNPESPHDTGGLPTQPTQPTQPTPPMLPTLPTSGLLPTTDLAGTGASTSTDTGAPAPGPDRPRLTFYDAVGGEETFRRLVHRFYEGVAEDAELRPMYPEEDLGPAEDRLRMFLVQYWGGPRDYTETRGHPRLRMRHVPFTITPYMRDRWLAHMQVAVEELALDEPYATLLWDYLVNAAHSLVNAFEEP